MKSFKFNNKWAAALVILLVVIGLYVTMNRRPTAPTESSGIVTRQDLTQRVTISGQVWPLHRLDVKAPYAGFIRKVYVQIGDHVKVDDPLVTFSPSLGKEETNFPIRAAFAGTVTQVLRGAGEAMAGNEQGDAAVVARVEDLSQIFILATVPELDIAKLKKGQKAMIKISALPNENFEGEIVEIALSAKDKDRWSSASTEFQIRILMNTHDPRLRSGMSALLDIVTADDENVLVLGHEYIQDDPEGYSFVTMLDGEKRKVELGLQTEEAVEIKSGLKEGDRVRLIDFLSLPKVAE